MYVDGGLAELFYHEVVLSAEHSAFLSGLVTFKKRPCRSGGQSRLMIYGLLAPLLTVGQGNVVRPLGQADKAARHVFGEGCSRGMFG